MKKLTKVDVVLVFPESVHFYGNINIFIYRNFLRFLYRMCCFTINIKCDECHFSNECRYYKCTGENFKKYPGILIKNDFFPKTLYQKNDPVLFTFYIIGSNDDYIEYLRIFFNSYLNQKLANNFFYLRSLTVEEVIEQKFLTDEVRCVSITDTTDFISEYNNTVVYYNKQYDCDFSILDNVELKIKNIKKTKVDKIFLPTKRIYPQGYLYTVLFPDKVKISSIINSIGVGKYNFIGGGHLENKNIIREKKF